MKKIFFLLSLLVLMGVGSNAQTNTTPCTAQRLCPNQQITGTPVGNSNFTVTGTCTALANQPTLFYTVLITGGNEFTFIINPLTQTDYDWALWKNVNCNNAITTIPDRISFDQPAPNNTGMTTNEPLGDNCESVIGGNGFLRGINVIPGDVLLIAVNFFSFDGGEIPPFNLFVGGANGGGGDAQFNCCPTNPSSQFTMTTNCANGNFSATVTASDPSLPNHSWDLYESSVEGNTSDSSIVNFPNTAQPTLFGSTATFNNLDPNKNYFIKHGIWENGCFTWMETRIAIPKIKLSYTLEDANGTVKNTFCLGEDVYLDGSTVNTYIGKYFIDIWEVVGGNANWLSAQGVDGWAIGALNLVNITDLFENDIQQPVVFHANHTYRVKLAIQSPCGWIETTKDFTYVCCESSTNAAFGLLTNLSPTGDLRVSLMPGSSGSQILSQEWCIYDAPNGNTGPYSLITCSPIPFSLVLTQGRCYYITYKVRTECGEACSGQTICNTGCRDIVHGDCDELSVPENLNCSIFNGQTQLTWDSVQGAIGYVIDVQVNDPDCCGSHDEGGLPFSLAPIEVHENSYFVNFDFLCYSWTVYAICENGNRSEVSRKVCMNAESCRGIIIIDPNTGLSTLKINPNPSKGDVNIGFETTKGDVSFNIDVYDMKGVIVKTFSNNQTTNGKYEINWNASGLAKGVYCVNIVTEKSEIITKKLIIQ